MAENRDHASPYAPNLVRCTTQLHQEAFLELCSGEAINAQLRFERHGRRASFLVRNDVHAVGTVELELCLAISYGQERNVWRETQMTLKASRGEDGSDRALRMSSARDGEIGAVGQFLKETYKDHLSYVEDLDLRRHPKASG